MRIRELRKQKGYTNSDMFAYEHNMDRTQYGRYERGEDMLCSTFLNVLDALNISPKEFFSEGFD